MTRPPPSPAADFRLAGLLSLGVLVVGLAGRGDPNFAVLLGGGAAANLWLRYSGGPFLLLAGVAWLLLYPFGFPPFTAGEGQTLPGTEFRLDDLIVLVAAAVHLQCQFRGLGFGRRLAPAEGAGSEPLKRPADLAPPGEYSEALAVALGGVFAAELLWALLLRSKVDLLAVPPVRDREAWPSGSGLELDAPLGRVVLAVGLLTAAGVAARFAFWLWRWATVGGDEARMALLDTVWRENRRELNRQEVWRAWGRRQRLEANRPRPRDDFPTWRRMLLGFGVFLVVFLSVRLVLRFQ